MAISEYRTQREKDKFIETKEGKTAIRISPELTNGIVKFDANDSAPNYIGINKTRTAATSEGTWTVMKFTYDGSNVTDIETAYGVWDDRASLFP